MNKQKIIRLALACGIFVAFIAASVLLWSSQLLQALTSGVVIYVVLVIEVARAFDEGHCQSENYH